MKGGSQEVEILPFKFSEKIWDKKKFVLKGIVKSYSAALSQEKEKHCQDLHSRRAKVNESLLTNHHLRKDKIFVYLSK